MSYQIQDKISEGSYGICYKGHDGKGKQYCFKKGYHKNNISGFGNMRELDILSRFSGESFFNKLVNIIIEYVKYSENQSITFVLELADMDGRKFLKERKFCTFQNLILLSMELLLAVEYLHWNKITHRDIKPSNMLIFNVSGTPHLRLCDFGFSNFLSNLSVTTPGIVTANYRAPEIIWEVPDYGYQSDIWSVGCTIYEMFTGKMLIYNVDDNSSALFDAILRKVPNKFEEHLSLYQREGRVNIRYALPSKNSNFMTKFKKVSFYHDRDYTIWKNLETLLLKTFNYNYRERLKASDCLGFELFKEHQNVINEKLSFKSHVPVLDIITIIKNEELYEMKKDTYMSLLKNEKFIRKLPLRIFFHALDLSNRYFNKYPQINEVEKVVRASLYFVEKYFSTLCFPMSVKFFFEVPKGEKEYFFYESLHKWIFDFEKRVLDIIYEKNHNYCFYRMGLYEMADLYDIKLTNQQLYNMFIEFLNLKSYNYKSYRAMFRQIYHQIIDPKYIF